MCVVARHAHVRTALIFHAWYSALLSIFCPLSCLDPGFEQTWAADCQTAKTTAATDVRRSTGGAPLPLLPPPVLQGAE